MNNFDSYLEKCNLCPRNCDVNRKKGEKGWCKTGSGFYISSICIHKGEEPPISGSKGICNVFFAHCNLQCVYCQNFQISDNKISDSKFEMNFEEVIFQITQILNKGISILGFVSASHVVPQMIAIISELNKKGYKPTIVYNSNGYDSVETLKKLENVIDVYLPDFKYFENDLSEKYSFAKDYPEIAQKAVKEMYRQKGSSLHIDDEGYAESGLIIRHLIIPNHVENSLKVLNFIAEEISTSVYISLMSQYYPIAQCSKFEELTRKINENEYQTVVTEMERLGFYKGFNQELESTDTYRPDFENEHPFE